MKALRGLLFEGDSGTVSVGRLSFWAVFILAVVLWATGQVVQFYHFLTVSFLLLYNLGKKAVWAWREVKTLIHQNGGNNVGENSGMGEI